MTNCLWEIIALLAFVVSIKTLVAGLDGRDNA